MRWRRSTAARFGCTATWALLGTQRARLEAVAASPKGQQQASRPGGAMRVIAEHLVALAALRRTLPREVLADDAARPAHLRGTCPEGGTPGRQADAVLQAQRLPA